MSPLIEIKPGEGDVLEEVMGHMAKPLEGKIYETLIPGQESREAVVIGENFVYAPSGLASFFEGVLNAMRNLGGNSIVIEPTSSLKKVGLSTRTGNTLGRAGINTVDDLKRAMESDGGLRVINGIGDKTIKEIHRKLRL